MPRSEFAQFFQLPERLAPEHRFERLSPSVMHDVDPYPGEAGDAESLGRTARQIDDPAPNLRPAVVYLHDDASLAAHSADLNDGAGRVEQLPHRSGIRDADPMAVHHFPTLPPSEKENADHDERKNKPRRDDGRRSMLVT